MPIDCVIVESLADEIVEGDKEVSFRCAASRYYYSGWYYANKWNKDKDIGVPHVGKGGMHSKFIDGMITLPGDMRRAGFLMKTMHSIRISADYDIADVFKKNVAKEVKSGLQNVKLLIPL